MSKALVLEKSDSGITSGVMAIRQEDLPDGDVVVSVLFSSLNYKDALAVTGKGKIIRGEYPFIPGIDLVGHVEDSTSALFAPGDLVIGTGWGLGETRWGGYTQVQRIKGSSLVGLPEKLSPEKAMILGTAGLTAMLSVSALEKHGCSPDQREVVVTGASGGVGSIAVALLAQLGYRVAASTGSADAHAYLLRLGAARIIDRQVLGQGPSRPMDSARWAGAVDSVGGSTLATIISQLDTHASAASCGLAGGHELHTTVFPFILRGVNLLGIDSNTCPTEHGWRPFFPTTSSTRSGTRPSA
jgi:acrylyl-CoA reductase (NADPH)